MVFTLTAGMLFGEGDCWVKVTLPGGGASVALVAQPGNFQTGRRTGIALDSSDPATDQAELRDKGVDVDHHLMRCEGGVPLLFFFRYNNGNHLMIVQAQ
ncbi:MAG: hypothetical protein JWM85_1855 [Acidimicrobiaceae bacterium]|nr:hypothetical protein [Acidimicrobiaceae bacterium]